MPEKAMQELKEKIIWLGKGNFPFSFFVERDGRPRENVRQMKAQWYKDPENLGMRKNPIVPDMIDVTGPNKSVLALETVTESGRHFDGIYHEFIEHYAHKIAKERNLKPIMRRENGRIVFEFVKEGRENTPEAAIKQLREIIEKCHGSDGHPAFVHPYTYSYFTDYKKMSLDELRSRDPGSRLLSAQARGMGVEEKPLRFSERNTSSYSNLIVFHPDTPLMIPYKGGFYKSFLEYEMYFYVAREIAREMKLKYNAQVKPEEKGGILYFHFKFSK